MKSTTRKGNVYSGFLQKIPFEVLKKKRGNVQNWAK